MISIQESVNVNELRKSLTATPLQVAPPILTKPSYNDLGIMVDRPKRPDLATKEARLRTFRGFSECPMERTEELSEAGFYYTESDDCTRCFHCGGGLRNWDSSDNVIVEHAKWFPKCSYIRLLKGHEFVSTVQNLCQRYDQVTHDMVKEASKLLGNVTELGDRKEKWDDPAIRSLCDLGCDHETVLEVAQDIYKENCSALSSDILLERLETHCNIPCKPMNLNNCKIHENKIQANLKENISDVKRQNHELRQLTTCKICMDKNIAVVFLPCCHFVSCLDCSMAMRNCPVCRAMIKGTVRALRS